MILSIRVVNGSAASDPCVARTSDAARCVEGRYNQTPIRNSRIAAGTRWIKRKFAGIRNALEANNFDAARSPRAGVWPPTAAA
jgi:hypothetical protein